MAKRIKLINSTQTAIVDDEDYEWVNQFEWFLEDGYAKTILYDEKVEMGWLIVMATQYGMSAVQNYLRTRGKEFLN